MTDPQPPICNYEGSDYQSRFWEHGGRAYEDQAEAIALQRLLPKSGELLLELGAGAGRNTLRYAGFKQVVLLDYSLSQLQQAMGRLGRNQRFIYVAADIYNLPFVDGLLQPGAIFILEYANKQNLKAILRFLARRQEWSPFRKESVEFEKLNFDFHPAAVRSWLMESGFSLQKQLAVSYFRLEVLKRKLPLSLLARLETWLQPTGRIFQLSPSVFTRSQVVGDKPKAKAGTFFKCPVCEAYDLKPHRSKMICPDCSREWSIRDGIFDFRIATD
jgi:SAM-dependent methyltransferase